MQIHSRQTIAAPRPALPRFGEDTSLAELKRKKREADLQAAIDAYYKDYGHGITGEGVLKLIARISEENKKEAMQIYNRSGRFKKAWIKTCPGWYGAVDYRYGLKDYIPEAHQSAARKARNALISQGFLYTRGGFEPNYMYLTDLGRKMLAGETSKST
jgi:hypothetical protein